MLGSVNMWEFLEKGQVVCVCGSVAFMRGSAVSAPQQIPAPRNLWGPTYESTEIRTLYIGRGDPQPQL